MLPESLQLSPDAFRFYLKERLSKPLPGLAAQKAMMPADRLSRLSEYNKEIPFARQGAVVVMIFPKMVAWHFLLIRRKERPGDVHSGQLGLPGGKVESTDTSPLYAALRETQEEVGLSLSDEALCGSLSPVYIPPSRFLVQPYVAVLDYEPHIVPAPEEVEAIHPVPLFWLFESRCKQFQNFKTSYGVLKNYPCYNFNGLLLWGATAMIMSEMEWILKGG